jgi:hypothetical protein
MVYVGFMTTLGIMASNINCQNCVNELKYNKNTIKKKRFKHYRTHLYNVRY